MVLLRKLLQIQVWSVGFFTIAVTVANLWFSRKYGYSLTSAIIQSVISGIFYGLFTTIGLGIVYRQQFERKGFQLTEENLAVKQRRSIDLQLPYEVAFDRCKKAINRIPKATIKQEDSAARIIVATVKMTGWSFGEKITLTLQPQPNNIVNVSFVSKPILRTTVMDYGKNLDNVETILRYLQAYRT